MRMWLSEPGPALADIHEDVLRGSWERLDAEQRSILKLETSRLQGANAERLHALHALPN